MRSEWGYRRLVNFSDAVVAIAITLLILPLVDSAASIGTSGLGSFLDANKDRLVAFTVSFAVIGDFWWGQHQTFERVRAYNSVLVGGMFLWLFSIVFLPFPTELIGTARNSSSSIHAVYVGTMLLATLAALLQQWAIVRWPELQDEALRGSATIGSALVLAILMAVALVVVITAPFLGLWPLVLLGLSRPIERLVFGTRRHQVHPA